MTFPRARLAVSACMFVAWLIFLFVLWLRSSTIILSKPQFLIAQLYVVVEVRDESGKADPDVTVEEVLWASGPADKAKKTLHLVNLPACAKPDGYQGAGKYLVPLVKSAEGFMVAPVPRADIRHVSTPRIYPWTPELRAQVEELIAAKK